MCKQNSLSLNTPTEQDKLLSVFSIVFAMSSNIDEHGVAEDV